MGMIAGNKEEKTQLAIEICEFSKHAILHHPPPTNKPPFINWYLVLKVDENADTYSIRKRYHKLALQLHPDKNSNSRAETAFKLVSEAYFCLSDTTRRRAFDRERNSVSCIKCNPNSFNKTTSPTTTTAAAANAKNQETTRRGRVQMRMRELRDKLKEEAAIIEKCLMGVKTRRESPVFDPSDYHHRSYPHRRAAEDWRAAALKIGNRGLHHVNAAAKRDDYPIFQCGSERVSSISRCGSMRERVE